MGLTGDKGEAVKTRNPNCFGLGLGATIGSVWLVATTSAPLQHTAANSATAYVHAWSNGPIEI